MAKKKKKATRKKAAKKTARKKVTRKKATKKLMAINKIKMMAAAAQKDWESTKTVAVQKDGESTKTMNELAKLGNQMAASLKTK